MLKARSRSCLSAVYVLKLDDRPFGQFRGRWFSEAVDIHLVGRANVRLKKVGIFGSHFELIDSDTGAVLGAADRPGFLSRAWNLRLSGGRATLKSAGLFNSGYHVVDERGKSIAEVNRVGLCEGGWWVHTHSLEPTDLVLVGLIYHTILERHRRRESQQ